MAIGFARMEFVKRGEGKNACAKSAYNARDTVQFDGNCVLKAQTFSWRDRPETAYSNVLLPEGVDKNFRNKEFLWNAIEAKENRQKSQVAMEVVLALPDDKDVSFEDKIKLTESFTKENFSDKGLAVQLDIHPPEENTDHNWHAHLLITTRRFKEDGRSLADKKARDLMPSMLTGEHGAFVVSAEKWGADWAKHQNDFFKENGLNLTVDYNAIVGQEHLGPVRMRGESDYIMEAYKNREEINQEAVKDSVNVITRITKTQSVFKVSDVNRFYNKHVDDKAILPELKKEFWNREDIVQLIDKKTGEKTDKFTTVNIIKEEKNIERLANRMINEKAFVSNESEYKKHLEGLTAEQKKAFVNIVSGSRLSFVEGHAGTGKSYLLAALKDHYIEKGYGVRGFGPDNATAKVLEEKNFCNAENNHKFLFANRKDKRAIEHNNEVWIVDEAGKVGNEPFLELLKAAEQNKAQVVFSGNSMQMSAVERGEMFRCLVDNNPSHTGCLIDIQRQKTLEHRAIAKSLATGDLSGAFDRIAKEKMLVWTDTKEAALELLVDKWAKDQKEHPEENSVIIAHANKEVNVLNEKVRLVKLQRGELGKEEFLCDIQTDYWEGKIAVSNGDKIVFKGKDQELGIENGMIGTLVQAEKDNFIVAVKESDKREKLINFNPKKFNQYNLGYAITLASCQGGTWDRAYISHSKYINKKQFYVAMSRHRKEVGYFIAKEEVPNLMALKRDIAQASRDTNSTLDYTSIGEQTKEKEFIEKWEKIEALKESDKFIDRLKGYGKGFLGKISEKFDKSKESKEDLRPNEDFYKYTPKKLKDDNNVEKIDRATLSQPKTVLEAQTEKDVSLEGGQDRVESSTKELSFDKMRMEKVVEESYKGKGFLNEDDVQNPKKTLDYITKMQSVFSVKDIDKFYNKHVDFKAIITDLKEEFWKNDSIVQLINKETGEKTNKFTTVNVIKEEKHIERLANRMISEKAFVSNKSEYKKHLEGLTAEQKKAFVNIVSGSRLSFVEGHAGTGKSHLLKALKDHYIEKGCDVRGFGPDNTTVKVLEEKGFYNPENNHKFLFANKNEGRVIDHNNEVWIVDESGKMENESFLELLKVAEQNKVQVVLSGNSSQMSAIGRGEMFKYLVDNNPSHTSHMFYIQRQNNLEHRDIVKSLATGDLSGAFDRIAKEKMLVWKDTKESVLESLVDKWGEDQKEHPNDNSVIIAHANKEVNILNEKVRAMRVARGEVSKNSFLCDIQTGYWEGKIFVSERDKIVFKGKNQDLGIENGMIGTLVQAEKDNFTVSVKESDKKEKLINFNPKKFNQYNLGYAITLSSCQGGTWDRAYISHSKYTSKDMLYVALSRHVKDVGYFIAKEEVPNLMALKRDVIKASKETNTTLDYTNNIELVREKAKMEENTRIEALRKSDNPIDREEGNRQEILNNALEKSNKAQEKIDDLKPNEDFYNVKEKKLNDKINIEKVNLSSYQLKAEISENKGSKDIEVYNNIDLSKEKTGLKKEYRGASVAASDLYAVVKAEASEKNIGMESASTFKEWQRACGVRNESAYKVSQSFESKELKGSFSKKSMEILTNHSLRHEDLQARKERQNQPSLTAQLKDNMDGLLFRLFPDGASWKNQSAIRFGAKGSLYVTMAGEKMGTFFDHENGVGGGPLALIQKQMGCSKEEAESWANEFLNNGYTKAPENFIRSGTGKTFNDSPWKSETPPRGSQPNWDKFGKSALMKSHDIVAKNAYREKNGDLAFFVVRLEKKDGSGKIMMPFSYGKLGDESKAHWAMKGYNAEKGGPLYKSERIRGSQKIIVVEGEKTADAANKLFEKDKNITCVTWCGGSGAVKKADWTVLAGKQVVIWPDNDKAGFKAAEDVTRELKKVGAKSVKVVDQEKLKKEFPEKWDLADSIDGKSQSDLKDMIILAKERNINPNQLFLEVKHLGFDKSQVNEVLWRVDERMREGLEENNGTQPQQVKQQIINESVRVLKEQSQIKEALASQHNLKGEALEKAVVFATIHQARTGQKLQENQIDHIREKIRDTKDLTALSKGIEHLNRDEKNLVFARSLEKDSNTKGISAADVKQESVKMESIANEQRLQASIQQEQSNEPALEI